MGAANPDTVGRRSLSDLLGRDKANADKAFGDKAPEGAWDDLTVTLNTLDAPARPSRQASTADAVQLHEDELDNDLNHDQLKSGADAILRDMSLKTVANLASDRSLDWLLTPSTLAKIVAAEMLSKSTDEIPNLDELGEDNDTDRPSILFCASLLNYCHPTGKHELPPGRWHAQLDDDASASVARLLDWQEALRSVFYALRYRRIRCFHLCLAECVIRFSSGKDKNSVRAHISRSKGFEDLLEEYCIEHTPDLSGIGIIVSGIHDVHSLYNMLLASAPSMPTARDVPLIVCDEPFPHASQAEAVIRNAFAAADDSGNMRYTVRIIGVLTSRQVHRLCQALSAVQDFDLTLVTDDKCGPTATEDAPRISTVRCIDGELQALSRRT